MRERAAHEQRMRHARQYDVGDELSLPGQQPPVFPPQQRAPDIGSRDVAHAGSSTQRKAEIMRALDRLALAVQVILCTSPLSRSDDAVQQEPGLQRTDPLDLDFAAALA